MRQNSSKVIGVAGGVGSGKSTVLDILRRKHDAVICMADELGHEVMRPGTAGFDKIREAFGEAILLPEGEIDRELLARRVYCDPDQLRRLNAIVHPLVRSERGSLRGTATDCLFWRPHFCLKPAVISCVMRCGGWSRKMRSVFGG